jgi:hypothetical protein
MSKSKFIFIVVFFFSLLFSKANYAFAAIVHGTAVTPGMQAGATTNISVTVATTPNPALFVSIFGVSSISSVTYNGVTMTRLWQVQYSSNVGLSSAFILGNPATGTEGCRHHCRHHWQERRCDRLQ